MSSRPWNPVRLVVVFVVAGVVAVTLLAAVVVLAVVSSSGGDEDTTTPAAPDDLCAVVGRDDVTTWVPGADPVSTVDGGQATCEATSADGESLLAVRVTRLAPREDQLGPSGRTQAEDSLDRACAEAVETDLGIGDRSCVARLSGGGDTGAADVDVLQGTDLISVSYFGAPLTDDEARARAVEAATRVAASLAG